MTCHQFFENISFKVALASGHWGLAFWMTASIVIWKTRSSWLQRNWWPSTEGDNTSRQKTHWSYSHQLEPTDRIQRKAVRNIVSGTPLLGGFVEASFHELRYCGIAYLRQCYKARNIIGTFKKHIYLHSQSRQCTCSFSGVVCVW